MEILAPAGGKEAFLAAVNNGADAVYCSGKQFGARAYASNFDREEIVWAVTYAHLRGVKVYITVNTLLTDTELPSALDFCAQLYDIGVDAIIVQDWGLIDFLRTYYPQISLNASTQMTFHNSAACKQAAALGFRRVILAREVSIAEMAAINQALAAAGQQLETEVFVHGALCVCYSGQCLFSSLVGGRSGNRGRCAQPCRLKYQLYNSGGKQLENGHLLSPKDLKGLEQLPEIAAAGVVSAKIEGRMKRPEYVATVTAAYARANQGLVDAATDIALQQAFNREFTSGYLLQNQGRDMMSYQRPNNRGTKLGRIEKVTPQALTVKLENELQIGDGLEIWVTKGGRQGFTVEAIAVDEKPCHQAAKGQRVQLGIGHTQLNTKYILPGDRLFKTLDSRLNAAAQATYLQTDNLPLTMQLTAKIGGKPILIVADKQQRRVELTIDFEVSLAEKHPADYDSVQKQLGRLGGSGYYLAGLEVQLQAGCMLPASVLNQARREALQLLQQQILQPYQRPQLTHAAAPAFAQHPKVQKLKLAVVVDTIKAAHVALNEGVDYLYLNAGGWQGQPALQTEQVAELCQKGAAVYLVLPVIAKETELAYWRQKMQEWLAAGAKGFVIGNLWPLQLAAEQGVSCEWLGDFSLNAFNSQAGEFLHKQGLRRVAVSPELNWQQIQQLQGGWQREALIFGNLKMMVSEHCPLGAVCGGKTAEQNCNKPCLQENYYLKDEKGFRFPLHADRFCRSHLYNGYLLCLLEDLAKFAENGIAVGRLDLSFLDAKTVGAIVAIFQQALQRMEQGLSVDFAEAKAQLAAFTKQPFTKGHYYRGVE